MPFRTMATLESWLEEFRALGYPLATEVRVIPQDADDDVDTGLVAAGLRHIPTTVYVAPDGAGSTAWHVTFEPRDAAASMTAAQVLQLSIELATLSALCAFLEAKSESFVRALADSA